MKKVLKSTLLAMTLVSAQQSTFAEDAPKVEAAAVAAPRTWMQVASDNKLTIAAAVAAMGIGVLAFYNQDEIKKYFESLSPEKLQETKGNLEDEVKKDQSVLSYLTSFLTSSAPAAQAAPAVQPEAAPVIAAAPAVSADAASTDVAPAQDADFADATVAVDADEAA